MAIVGGRKRRSKRRVSRKKRVSKRRVSRKKRVSKRRVSRKKRVVRKVHVGKRGGRYVVKKGRKVYI